MFAVQRHQAVPAGVEFHGILHAPACIKALQLWGVAVGQLGMLPIGLLAKLLRKAVECWRKDLRLLALQRFLQGHIGLKQVDVGQLINLIENVMGIQGLHAEPPVATNHYRATACTGESGFSVLRLAFARLLVQAHDARHIAFELANAAGARGVGGEKAYAAFARDFTHLAP